MPGERNHYNQLGVPFDASPEEIRLTFRELAMQLHPDRNPDPGAAERFILIQKSYAVLSDPEQRAQYDNTLPANYKVQPLGAAILYSRGSIHFSDEPQVIYALIKLAPQGMAVSDPGPPLNVCLVMDCSTSMHGALLDTVKFSAIELVRQMRPQDILSVVAFSDRASVVVPAGALLDRDRIETSIRMLTTSGGTELYQGLQAGYDEVQRHRSAKYINHIVLITDGRTYGDEPACLDLARQAAVEHIGISGLGIGGQWNDQFLDQLTSITGGSTMFVTEPKDVEKLLKQKFSGFGAAYAEQVRFDFTSDPGVKLRYAFRIQPDASLLETTPPFLLGSVQRTKETEIILDFYIDPINSDQQTINLANGRIHFDIPTNSDKQHHSLRIDLQRTVSKEPDPLAPPQSIVQAMSHLTLYRIQERARQDVDDGNYKEASQRLQNLATHLLAQGERELARTVLGEAVYIQQNKSFSEIGDKRIKYGTRALLLPSHTKESNI